MRTHTCTGKQPEPSKAGVESPGPERSIQGFLGQQHLPFLQVLHVRTLEGSFQEVSEFIVNRGAAFEVPRCAVV